jgi:hypothetical protein
MTAELLVEYLFKGIISVGVGLVIWTLKDFKVSLTKLTDSLTAVTISLRELIIKDENKSESLTEMKSRISRLENDVSHQRVQIAELKTKHKE